MRKYLVVFWLLLLPVEPATAQVNVGFGFSDGDIGISLQLYPELERVPGYPVYFAPRLDSNYFFYDGMYWVYQRDNWYASSWYNGPWRWVDPEDVPYYVLRVPVRYYRQPPLYFQSWQVNAPPRWGDHWGSSWAQHRSGWDRWDRNSAPAPAPLPVYQRKYSGDRYPGAAQQRTLHNQKYRYQPREPVVRQLVQKPRAQGAPAPVRRDEAPGMPPMRNPPQRDNQHAYPSPPAQKSVPTPPRAPSRQQGEDKVQHPAPTQDRQQNRQPKKEAPQHPPTESRTRQTGAQVKDSPGTPGASGAQQEPRRQQKPGKEKDHENADDRGQGHGR